MRVAKENYRTAAERMSEQMEREGFPELYRRAIAAAMAVCGEVLRTARDRTGREVAGGLCGRIKQPESIVRKLQKKRLPLTCESAAEKLNDLAGVRVTCYYLDDVRLVGELLRERKDIRFIKEKDYISKPKNSGYRSLHQIVEVPVGGPEGVRWVRVEIQLRTTAMDLWARLDHRLCYKKEKKEIQPVVGELKEYAGLVEKVDVQMMSIRRRIDEIGRRGQETDAVETADREKT